MLEILLQAVQMAIITHPIVQTTANEIMEGTIAAMVKQICIVITVVTTTTQKMCATSCMVFPMIDQEIHPEIRIFLSVL